MLVDAENVRRSKWPNLSKEELVERCGAWAKVSGHRVVVVFDGPPPDTDAAADVTVAGTRGETADEWLKRAASGHAERGEPFWLVTSDRALRAEAGARAARVVGGGSFVRSLFDRG